MFVYAEKIPLSILRERSPSICLYSSKAYTAAIHSKKLNSKQQTCLLNAVFLFVCLFYFYLLILLIISPGIGESSQLIITSCNLMGFKDRKDHLRDSGTSHSVLSLVLCMCYSVSVPKMFSCHVKDLVSLLFSCSSSSDPETG